MASTNGRAINEEERQNKINRSTRQASSDKNPCMTVSLTVTAWSLVTDITGIAANKQKYILGKTPIYRTQSLGVISLLFDCLFNDHACHFYR